MKIWSRDFTRKEKILLLVLALILVGLVYYQFVDKPVRRSIAESKAECEAIETELAVAQTKAQHLQKLESELNDMKSGETISYMASYNNSREEVALLNDILSNTKEYTINFADVTRSKDQIRRNFTLQFRTSDYAQMRQVIKELCASPYRCLVGDIQCTANRDRSGATSVTAKETATCFETMVGGTPDAGLPEDKAAAETVEE